MRKTGYTLLQLRARAWGPVNGLPILALHGWMDNANSFVPLAPYLSEFRLVALDLPGQGLSQWRPPGSHYHFIDFCADILFAADALEWQNFSILGHSFGAAIGLVSACMVPERIDRLALIDNFGPRVDTGINSIQRLRHAYRDLRLLNNKKQSRFKQVADATRVRQLVSDLDVKNTEYLLQRGLKETTEGYTWTSDPQLKMASPAYIHELQLLSYLQHLKAPSLLIRAQSGHLFNSKDLEARYKLLDELQIVNLPGGHHVHMETPETVGKYLTHFFKTKRIKPCQ
jgi:pimeloyl-ACP methyl ester carboxylesterase